MKIILETANGHYEYEGDYSYKCLKSCLMKELKKKEAKFATFIISGRDEPFVRSNVTILKYWEYEKYSEIKGRFKNLLRSIECLRQS